MSRRALLGTAVVLFLAGVACTSREASSTVYTPCRQVSLPTWSPDGTQIVYYGRRWPAPTGHRNPNQAYCTMNADGSKPQPLANTACNSCQDPPGQIVWLRPDEILYLVDGPIYSLAPDGKPKMLTTTNAESFAVNAEKTRIASSPNFRGCVTCSGPVTVMSLATGHRVGSVGGSKYDNMNPSLSPDGKQVVFERNPDTDTKSFGLWTANASGTNVRQLLKVGHQPLWSPAGNAIAYLTWAGKAGITSASALHLIAPAGGKSRLLVRKNVEDVFGWSPDGASIAFESGSTLSVVEVRTGKVRALLPLKYEPTAAWSEDSSKLVVNTVTKLNSKGVPQCWATYVVPADGSAPTKISSCS
jgi:putative hemolysin